MDSDGYRELPNGSDLVIEIESVNGDNEALTTALHLADTLEAMGIQSDGFHDNFGWTEAYERMSQHHDFDIVFMKMSFDDYDASWLGYEFWSNYSHRPYTNLANFRNQTYDAQREGLLYSAEYSEVESAAAEMQEILLYECPVIPVYQAYFVTAYRTDKFEGMVNDSIHGIPCWWTNQKVRLLPETGGPWGGDLRWSLPTGIDTFNFMATSSPHTWKVLQMLYDSLLRRSPNGSLMKWLADTHSIETHDDNPDVIDGHTRITFNIIDWALWTDISWITAEDVAFSLNFYREADGNPYGSNLDDMISATAPTSEKVIIEFNTESIWHLEKIAFKPILPKHVFNQIDPDDWALWEPNPPSEEMVTSGSFNVSDYVEGEFCELNYNIAYMYQHPPCGDSVKFRDGWEPWAGPPRNLTYIEGSHGNVIHWYITGHRPYSFSLLYEDLVLSEGLLRNVWPANHISLNVDNLTLGLHHYTLVVEDIYNIKRNSTIVVEVITQAEAISRQVIQSSPIIISVVGLVIILLLGWRAFSRNQ
jgi:ABC-type transport system substrate-binding protein